MTSLRFCLPSIIFYNFTFTVDHFNLTIFSFDGHHSIIYALFRFLFVSVSESF